MAPNTNMDPRIWSQLPEELLERILSFLPLKTFLNLRSTCRNFNSLLFSPNFVSKHSPSSSSSPFSSFIILSHPHFVQKCHLFNTVLNSWCSMCLSLPPMLPSTSSSSLLSTSNGLLCFSIPTSSCFIIYNLLARSTRRIKFPTCPFDYEFLTLVSTSNGYKLFMQSSFASSANHVVIYDSAIQSWLQFEGCNPILSHSYYHKGAFYNGCLFFTTPEPFTIVCFDFDAGKWRRSRMGLPQSLTFVRLVSDDDRKLYLIGGVGENGISRSIKLWELGEDGENWVKMETLPEMLCRKFVSVCYHNYEHIYCFWHQGLICVCCYTWPEILYYKVCRRTWHWLPKCPSLPDKWSCGFRWFPFKPELYSVV